MVVSGSGAIGYDTIRKQFKSMCGDLGLTELDIHSSRIGGASEVSILGRSQGSCEENWRLEECCSGRVYKDGGA